MLGYGGLISTKQISVTGDTRHNHHGEEKAVPKTAEMGFPSVLSHPHYCIFAFGNSAIIQGWLLDSCSICKREGPFGTVCLSFLQLWSGEKPLL